MKLLSNMTKKGQMMTGATGQTIATFFGLFFIGILVFAFVLAGDSMQDATTDTTAINVINKTMSGVEDYANFSPALWIIAGVGLLIAILVGSVGVYFLGGRQ